MKSVFSHIFQIVLTQAYGGEPCAIHRRHVLKPSRHPAVSFRLGRGEGFAERQAVNQDCERQESPSVLPDVGTDWTESLTQDWPELI